MKLITLLLYLISFNCFAMSISNKIKIEIPKNSNGKAIIIVPAKKYSMKEELFQKMTEQALANNYIVALFDWKFYTKNIEPSLNLEEEVIELQTIIVELKKKYNISAKNIIIAAKSFGSRVLARSDLSLLGPVALITPNCDDKNKFKDVYSKLIKHKYKIQVSISVDDPYCDVRQIYQSSSIFSKDISIYTTFGDHNFNTTKNTLNQNAFVSQFINWLKNI